MNVKVASLGVCYAIFAAAGCGVRHDDEIKKLVGQWKIVKMDGSSELPDEEVRTVTFTDKQVTMPLGPNRQVTGSFTIDPKKDPKWMDIEIDFRGEPFPGPGIYKLDGDKLTIVVINRFPNGKPPPRPTTFEGELPGVVVHLERIKNPQ